MNVVGAFSLYRVLEVALSIVGYVHSPLVFLVLAVGAFPDRRGAPT